MGEVVTLAPERFTGITKAVLGCGMRRMSEDQGCVWPMQWIPVRILLARVPLSSRTTEYIVVMALAGVGVT